ncbi:MAG: glycosyltransferase family 9 protein, partial [Alphaproteobacteria bacterium]
MNGGETGAGGARILVIRLGALGDFVQSMGPFAAIRRHHANARITLLTTAPYVALGEASGYFDAVWIDARPPGWRFAAWLRLRRRLR